MRILMMMVAAATAAVSLAACGSSSQSSAGTAGSQAASSNQNKALAFATCMRAHGVPNFPDPTGGRIRLKVTQTPGSMSVNGVEVNAPAFQSAMQACRKDLPNAGQPPKLSASRQQAMLQYARCMRSHGVPEFPDPTFSGGRVAFSLAPGSGVNPQSPAFTSAQRTCQSILGSASQVPGGP